MHSHGVDFSELAIEKEYQQDIEISGIRNIIQRNIRKSKFKGVVGLKKYHKNSSNLHVILQCLISTEEFAKLFKGKQNFNSRIIGRKPQYSLQL